jgi:beta-lactamase class A
LANIVYGSKRTDMKRISYYRPRTASAPKTYQKQQRHKNSFVWLLFFMILAAMVFGYRDLNAAKASAKSRAKAEIVRAITPSEEALMDSKIQAVIDQNPNVETAVSIIDLKAGKTYDYGESSTNYIAASISKLITATLFLHGVEKGDYTLGTDVNGDSAQDQLEQMIVNSDNDSWQAFNDLLGHDALQAWAAQAGIPSYNADDNELSSSDTARLLANLYSQKLLNGPNTKLLLSYMGQAEGIDYVSKSVPVGVTVYQKAGWLDDRIHDATIIDDGKNPYVLVIFTKMDGQYDTALGQQVFQSITEATTTTFIKHHS